MEGDGERCSPVKGFRSESPISGLPTNRATGGGVLPGAATECDAASRQPELLIPVILEGAGFAPEGPMHLACS
jgi:hypothetical protein